MNAVLARRQHEVTPTPARAVALHTLSLLRGRLDSLEALIVGGEPAPTRQAAEVKILAERLDQQVLTDIVDEMIYGVRS